MHLLQHTTTADTENSIDLYARPRWRTTSNSVCVGIISTQICPLASTNRYVVEIWWMYR